MCKGWGGELRGVRVNAPCPSPGVGRGSGVGVGDGRGGGGGGGHGGWGPRSARLASGRVARFRRRGDGNRPPVRVRHRRAIRVGERCKPPLHPAPPTSSRDLRRGAVQTPTPSGACDIIARFASGSGANPHSIRRRRHRRAIRVGERGTTPTPCGACDIIARFASGSGANPHSIRPAAIVARFASGSGANPHSIRRRRHRRAIRVGERGARLSVPRRRALRDAEHTGRPPGRRRRCLACPVTSRPAVLRRSMAPCGHHFPRSASPALVVDLHHRGPHPRAVRNRRAPRPA